MSAYTLTKTRLFEGIWEGVISTADADAPMPAIQVMHRDQALDNIHIAEHDTQSWSLRIPIPTTAIADGVQTFLINDTHSNETLDVITLIAGEALAGDIRSEIDLLRAELDMLKRAFRRHCLETM